MNKKMLVGYEVGEKVELLPKVKNKRMPLHLRYGYVVEVNAEKATYTLSMIETEQLITKVPEKYLRRTTIAGGI